MEGSKRAYEQPLNERIRSFLRLEYLFARAAYRIDGETTWDSRATLDAIIDILTVLGRSDLRTELIKELDRHSHTLEALRANPGVDPQTLDQILGDVRGLLSALRASDKPVGQELRNHELMNLVRQRSSIPAGSCSFDLPAFQFWLQRPAEDRLTELQGWLQGFDLIHQGVTLCLNLIRGSAVAARETAQSGFFQRNLDSSSSCQMVRVLLPHDALWYPEVSGGRHRFTIRFMEQPESAERPLQTSDEVAFELQCCMI